MAKVNPVLEFDAFMEYAEDNMLSMRERSLWIALYYLAKKKAVWNEQSRDFSWPDDFFPVSNDAIHSNACLDKRGVADARNSLKQRGIIYFMPGEKKKRHPMYKLFYFSEVRCAIGYENAPNSTPENDQRATKERPVTPQRATNDAPEGDLSATKAAPFNNSYINNIDLEYLNSISSDRLEKAKKKLNINDEHWRYSTRALAATAQQVVDAIVRDAMWGRDPKQTEGLYDMIFEIMQDGEHCPLVIYLMACKSAMRQRFNLRLAGIDPWEVNGE